MVRSRHHCESARRRFRQRNFRYERPDPADPGGRLRRGRGLPASFRTRAAAQYSAGTLSRLTDVIAAWCRGIKLGDAAFAERFFGRTPDDAVVEKLHGAALDIGLATNHGELREASEQLAEAIRLIGLDRWPRFLADAAERAHDPATIAAIEKSRQPPDLARDAIKPSQPNGLA